MFSGDEILVTGVSSGLGKTVAEQFPNCIALNRENRNETIASCKNKNLKAIVHCAFNSSNKIKDYYKYLDDNILLTNDLLNLQPEKFVYISSVDVYADDGVYKTFKLLSESLIKEKCENNLILRSPAILGKNMRYNSLLKIIKENNLKLTLSKDSTFNYILQDDIIDFIKYAISEDITGTFDFVSSTNVSLEEVETYFNRNVAFGDFCYTTPSLSNKKLIKLFNQADKTSMEVVNKFLDILND
tara:strand:- start:835 stop:1563 length:729 start_codon:yes stop_codon:yes gene_type:complete